MTDTSHSHSKKLLFVGCGNMGEAILRGVLSAGRLTRGEIAVVEPLAARRAQLSEEIGVAAHETFRQAGAFEAAVLAVKPQQIQAALEQMRAAMDPGGALVISIAAGVATGAISATLGATARIVRAMPNTPMLAGCGCTGLCAGPGASAADLDFACEIFSAAGGEVHRVAETDMDAVTAVSGSGPAYFFYLIEAMIAAGVAEGLDPRTAAALATKTCEGAARLIQHTHLDPAELRRRVTSPGGTTQAAIASMDASGVGAALEKAVRAAAARGRELGK